MNSQRKTYIASASKNGRRLNALVSHPGERGLFAFDSLADAGLVRILSHGEENVYFEFTDDNGAIEAGYCKCL